MVISLYRAEEEIGRGTAIESVSLMRSLVVVEGHEALEGAIHGCSGGEVPTAEGDPPVLVEDGPLESLDEAVGPAVARLCAGMANAELAANGVEETFELATTVGKDALELPAGLSIGGQENALEKPRTVNRLHRGDDLCESEGAGRIAGRDLPERAHALELADVEAVQADQIAGQLGFDMAGAAVASVPKTPARPLGEKTSGSRAVVLEDGQPLMPRPKPCTSKKAARRRSPCILSSRVIDLPP
jgi:hypothetical protein